MADAISAVDQRLGGIALRLDLSPDWSSLRENYRQNIHAAVNRRPAQTYFSISHCQKAGGFVSAKRPIGFDVEVATRVRPEIIARVASVDECLATPTPALLWSAKEAAYKALPEQPTTISEITIFNWRSGNDGVFEFQIEVSHNEALNKKLSACRGFAWETDGLSHALFIIL